MIMTICKVAGCENKVAKRFKDGERIEYEFCREHKCIHQCGNIKAEKSDGTYKARCTKCLARQAGIETNRYWNHIRPPEDEACHES